MGVDPFLEPGRARRVEVDDPARRRVRLGRHRGPGSSAGRTRPRSSQPGRSRIERSRPGDGRLKRVRMTWSTDGLTPARRRPKRAAAASQLRRAAAAHAPRCIQVEGAAGAATDGIGEGGAARGPSTTSPMERTARRSRWRSRDARRPGTRAPSAVEGPVERRIGVGKQPGVHDPYVGGQLLERLQAHHCTLGRRSRASRRDISKLSWRGPTAARQMRAPARAARGRSGRRDGRRTRDRPRQPEASVGQGRLVRPPQPVVDAVLDDDRLELGRAPRPCEVLGHDDDGVGGPWPRLPAPDSRRRGCSARGWSSSGVEHRPPLAGHPVSGSTVAATVAATSPPSRCRPPDGTARSAGR